MQYILYIKQIFNSIAYILVRHQMSSLRGGGPQLQDFHAFVGQILAYFYCHQPPLRMGCLPCAPSSILIYIIIALSLQQSIWRYNLHLILPIGQHHSITNPHNIQLLRLSKPLHQMHSNNSPVSHSQYRIHSKCIFIQTSINGLQSMYIALLLALSYLFLCSSLLKYLFSSFSLYSQLIHNLKTCYSTKAPFTYVCLCYSFLSLSHLQLHLPIHPCVYKLIVISSPLIISNGTAAIVSYHICCTSSSSSLIDKSSLSPHHWQHYLRWSVLLEGKRLLSILTTPS